jgi:hypothetical protein
MDRLLLSARGLVGLGGALFFSGCFEPQVRDCVNRCEVSQLCPRGTSCVDGYCRTPGAPGSCAPVTDAGDAGDAGDGGDAGDTLYNYMFLTSETYVPGTLGGLEGADARCNALAQKAPLPGHYKAWLSTSTVDARSRLITPGGVAASGWMRPDGRPFAVSLEALLRGQILFPPRVAENGTEVLADHVDVATGTDQFGLRLKRTAGDWSSPTEDFDYGTAVATVVDWTNLVVAAPAGTPSHLYCFGVDQDRALPITKATGRTAFVSAAPLSLEGLAAADALCQNEATAANLTGAFRALLATRTASAASRFDLSGPPWVRLDGVPWVNDAAALARGELLTALDVDSLGAYVNNRAWTGAPDPMHAGTFDCDDWATATSASTGVLGYTGYANRYFFRADEVPACDFLPAPHVYCLQQ